MIESCCKLCGETKGKEVLDVSNCHDTYLDYMGIKYKDLKRYYKECDSCGFTYRNYFLTEAEKDHLYSIFRDQGLRNETHYEYFQRVSSLPKEKSENHEKYEYLKTFLKNTGSHLDVGGGLGVFAYGFQEYFPGWKSLVIEPTPGSSEIAEKHGVKVHEVYLDENSHKTIGKNFDLITANHVVEHVDYPVDFLKLLKQYLSETGMICIEMPSTLDIGFLEINHDRFMSQHEVIYNNKTVEILASKASLRVIANENYVSKRGRNNVRAILSK